MVLAYCGGMYHFLAWADGSSRSRGRAHLAALGLWLAWGGLGKFVAILFLPLVVGATLLWHPQAREKARADWRGLGLAALFAVCASLPWYAQQSLEHGSSLWRTLLVDHVIRRFTAGLDAAHLHAWSYYLEAALRGTRELSLLVVAGMLLWVTRALRTPWLPGRAVLLWWALPLAILSFGTSKLVWYAYPFLPPLGLFGGYAASRLARSWSASLAAARWRDSRALRAAAALGAVVAWSIALLTAWQGPVRVDWLHFRSSTLERPLLTGALLAHFALASIRPASGLMAATAAVVLCWASYSRVWQQLAVTKRPAASLVECLARREGAGFWLMEDATLLHHYDHYLRRYGVARHHMARVSLKFGETPAPPSDAAILVERGDLLEFGRLGWWRKRAAEGRRVDGGDSLLLLSGSYRDCARAPDARGGPFLHTR
jgi:4-amino-4-deoxy-L-arabinose transferase-like glycosyltransferase